MDTFHKHNSEPKKTYTEMYILYECIQNKVLSQIKNNVRSQRPDDWEGTFMVQVMFYFLHLVLVEHTGKFTYANTDVIFLR